MIKMLIVELLRIQTVEESKECIEEVRDKRERDRRKDMRKESCHINRDDVRIFYAIHERSIILTFVF